MRNHAVIVLMAALALCLTPAIAGADVVYNTFANTNPFSSDHGWHIAGYVPYVSIYSGVAQKFTVTGGDYYLNSLDVGARWTEGTNSLKVSLMADNLGSVGAKIESATVSFATSEWETLAVVSAARPLLKDGNSYWIAVEPESADTRAVWCFNSSGIWGSTSTDNGYGWLYYSVNTFGNFRVNGLPSVVVVPEPPSLLALLGGSGAMGGIMLRRKK